MSGSSIGHQAVSLIAAQTDLLEAFLSACGLPAAGGELSVPPTGDLSLRAFDADALAEGRGVSDVAKGDAIVLLVRYADGETLDRIRAGLGRLPAPALRALNVFLCRNAGESEFKISCPKCGQKLMIRDALAFKRVTCPNCKKPFTVPGQSDLLHEELMIPAMRSIRKVNLGDGDSCRNALTTLTWQVREIEADAKSSTMRIDLLPDKY